jgi:hypothetical protein
MSDKYDLQIERLCGTEDDDGRRDVTMHEWTCGTGLFQFATPHGFFSSSGDGDCGCLTMIADTNDDDQRVAWTAELTAAIRADSRLPSGHSVLRRLAHSGGEPFRIALSAMAEWRRRLDREIRTPAGATP